MDENVHSGEWMSYLKIFLLIPALSGTIFYYIPVSRTYFRQGCLLFIDKLANTLKNALNAYEPHDVATSPDSISPVTVLAPPVTQEHGKKSRAPKRQRKHEHRRKNRNIYEDVKEMKNDWSTHIYPDRKLQIHRDSISDFEWDQRMRRQINDNILYSENDGSSHYYNDHLLIASADDLENLSREKMLENLKTKNHNYHNNQHFHHKIHEGEQDADNKIKAKVRKVRNKKQLIVSQSQKPSQENTEDDENVTEITEFTNDYLTNLPNQVETEWSRKNDTNHSNISGLSMENDKTQEVDNMSKSRLNRNFKSSTKKESTRKHKRNQVELPALEIEDFITDSEYYLQTPIITDRVTPIVQSAYQWVFGGCPSSKRKKR